jgi:hypothetical protein
MNDSKVEINNPGVEFSIKLLRFADHIPNPEKN